MQVVDNIVFFEFEEDFVEENVRCIPMIVRFKMDLACIKLKLSEWSKFSIEERNELAIKACSNVEEIEMYKNYLTDLITYHTGNEASIFEKELQPEWAELKKIPELLEEKVKEFEWQISAEQWKNLTNLQRFVLLKLCRPGHENKNFPKAMKEFSLVE